MDRVSRVVTATQYTGSNGADVLAMCQAITQYSGNVWSIDSDDGQMLQLREVAPMGPPALWPVTAGQWVIVAPDTGIIARMPANVYAARYQGLADIVSAAVAANVNVIAASEPVQTAIKNETAKAMYGGFGVAALPALLGGVTSSPIPVALLPAQPDTGYVARAFAISGAAVLTTVEIVSITKTSGSVANVIVKNTGVLSLSGVLLLHITAPVGGAQAPK